MQIQKTLTHTTIHSALKQLNRKGEKILNKRKLEKELERLGIGRKLVLKDIGIERYIELTKKEDKSSELDLIKNEILRMLLRDGFFPDCESILDIPTCIRKDLEKLLKSFT